jgi:hypothetical protein
VVTVCHPRFTSGLVNILALPPEHSPSCIYVSVCTKSASPWTCPLLLLSCFSAATILWRRSHRNRYQYVLDFKVQFHIPRRGQRGYEGTKAITFCVLCEESASLTTRLTIEGVLCICGVSVSDSWLYMTSLRPGSHGEVGGHIEVAHSAPAAGQGPGTEKGE